MKRPTAHGSSFMRIYYMPCQHCGRDFDPIKHRWLCPWCKTKNTCCEIVISMLREVSSRRPTANDLG